MKRKGNYINPLFFQTRQDIEQNTFWTTTTTAWLVAVAAEAIGIQYSDERASITMWKERGGDRR